MSKRMSARKAPVGEETAVAAAPAPDPGDRLELYRRIFAASADAIAIVTPDGHYLEQNDAHRELTGYSDDELRGRTPALHLGEEAFAHIAAELQAHGSYRGEHISRSKGGAERVVDLAAFTVHNAAGQPICHVGIKRDISGRKRSENEIRARVQQQAAVAELGRRALAGREIGALMQDASDLLTSTMPVDLAVVFELQPGGEQLLVRAGAGCDPQHIGQELAPVHGDSAAAFAFRRGEPLVFENLPDDKRFAAPLLRRYGVISGMYVPMQGREHPLGLIGAHTRTRRTFSQHDLHFLQSVANVLATVMQRQQDQEVLQRAEKLAMVGRMAAAVAHEINNPLESVINLLYLLETCPGLDATARAYVEVAQEEVRRAAYVARQTLSFYRESATVVPVNIGEVLDSILKVHARRLQSERIQVERQFHFAGTIEAFPAEMRQVFSNLILNALDAAAKPGRLWLRVYQGRNWRNGGRGIRVVVADNGSGIAPEHRARVFEPFFTTKGDKGTGLGLWVSQAIVNRHGGYMRVRSSVRAARRGTVFTVFLPSGRAAQAAERRAS